MEHLRSLLVFPVVIILSVLIVGLAIISLISKNDAWKLIPVFTLLGVVLLFPDVPRTVVGWVLTPLLNLVIWITGLISDAVTMALKS